MVVRLSKESSGNMSNSKKSIESFAEDSYVCTLSDELQNFALQELREEPQLRQHAIDSMRHFIEKQQHIIKCRMDSNYLLRFLRARKFNIPTAQQSLDNYLSLRYYLPEVMQKFDLENPIMADMIDLGILIPLAQKDKFGRTVILSQISAINPEKHSANDILRLWNITAEILLEDEYTQIHGVNILCRSDHVTLAIAGMWTLTNLKKAVLCVEKAMPMRNKGINYFRAPVFMVKIFEIVKKLVSKKLSERIKITTNVEELYDIFPKQIFPKELGGEKPLKEIIDDWKAILKTKREMLLLLDEAFEINENLRPKGQKDPYKLGTSVEGSFRKLEID